MAYFVFKNEKDLNECVGRVVQRSTKSRGVSIRDLNLHSGPVTTSADYLSSVFTHIQNDSGNTRTSL